MVTILLGILPISEPPVGANSSTWKLGSCSALQREEKTSLYLQVMHQESGSSQTFPKEEEKTSLCYRSHTKRADRVKRSPKRKRKPHCITGHTPRERIESNVPQRGRENLTVLQVTHQESGSSQTFPKEEEKTSLCYRSHTKRTDPVSLRPS